MQEEDKGPKSLSDIIDQLDYVESARHPTIEYYLKIDSYFGEIQKGISIIRGYQTNASHYDIARMNEDLIVLSAIHVSTAEMIGFVQGHARRTEEVRKITKSTYAIKVRDARDALQKKGTIIKINDPDIDNASRMLAKEQYLNASDAETVSHMMKYAWYAIGDFIKILNASINRSHQEVIYGTNGEGRTIDSLRAREPKKED